MADTDQRVEIGFEGGLILGMRLAASEWAKLEAGLAAGESVVVVETAEGTHHIRVDRVSYVKHESHVGKIGF